MSLRLLASLIFFFSLCIALLGWLRLDFDTDILGVLPANVDSIDAMADFQRHFAQDRTVIALLHTHSGLADSQVEDLCNDLSNRLGPNHRVSFQPALNENTEHFSETIATLWSYAPADEVDRLITRLLKPVTLQTRLDEILFHLADPFNSAAVVGSYDPFGFLEHPTLKNLANTDASYESDDGKFRLLQIEKTEPSATGYRDDSIWIKEIRTAIDGALSLKNHDQVTYQLTGGPAFNAEIGSGMEKDMSGTITLTSILIGLLFLLVQRNIPQLLVIIALLGITFFITLGLAGLIYGKLNLVSVGFAAILLGLVIDYAIVIARESAQISQVTPSLLRKAVFQSIGWASISTASVFAVLALSTFSGVKQLGGLVAIGLMVGAFVILSFAPLYFGKRPSTPPSHLIRPRFPSTRLSITLASTLLVSSFAFIAINGFPAVQLSLNSMEPRNSEAAAAFATVQSKFAAWSDKNTVLLAKASSASDLTLQSNEARNRLEELKPELLHWDPLVIPQALHYRENWRKFQELPESVLLKAEALVLESGFTDTALELDRSIIQALKSLPQSPDVLTSRCAVDPIIRLFYHLDDQGMHYLTGRTRIPQNSKQSLNEIFKDLPVNATGWPVIQHELKPRITQDFFRLFLPATAVLISIIFLIFRNWREALLSTLILGLSLTLINLIMVVTGHTWNFLNGIAIPLIVGAGMDFSIHLLFALRREKGNLLRVWNGVAKAITFCGLSTTIGFASLLLASNDALKSMGFSCSIGVFITMLLSLLLIPGLWKGFCESSHID